MIRKALFIILLCLSAVKMESEDIGSSGEGEATAMNSTPDSQFINNDGDLISTATLTTMDSEFISNMEGNFDEALNDNTTTTREAKPETTTTTFAPTTTPTPETTTTTPYPTTIAETTTTSMETTTTTTTTTTAAPETTTTPKPTTTTTKKPTTTTRRTTRRTTTRSPTTKSSTTIFPEITEVSRPSGDLCEFVDSDLKCDVEVMCYGEGELDCSDTADGTPSEPSILSKIFSPTFEEISDEYDDMGSETIPTFPPENVGKTMFPSLFKFGSLATTESSSTLMPEDTTTEARVTQQETTVRTTTTTELPTTTSTVTTTKATTTVSTTVTETTTMESEAEVMANTTVDEMASAFPSTVADSLTTMNSKMVQDDASTTATSADSDGILVQRRKRDDIGELLPSASSSMSVSMHVAALEGPKQRVKTCRIIGSMVCSPTPTRDTCRGRSACQVITGTSKTSEKATSAKSLVNWTIAVIVMCIIAGILTVSIVVYFVVTSWKKLKVQPQNGVTTLTYVNSTPP